MGLGWPAASAAAISSSGSGMGFNGSPVPLKPPAVSGSTTSDAASSMATFSSIPTRRMRRTGNCPPPRASGFGASMLGAASPSPAPSSSCFDPGGD